MMLVRFDSIKNITIVVCTLLLAIIFTSCNTSENKVIASLGRYEKREYFSYGDFQDYTDYGKYYYTSARVLNNNYLKKIEDTDLEEINTCLDDFEKWIEIIEEEDSSSDVVVNYDFDRTSIDSEDYFYIDSEEHTWSDGRTSLTSYNIYLFDSQTSILYFFHNNI